MRRILYISLSLFCMFLTSDLGAAKPSGLDKPDAKSELFALKNPIEQAQEVLSELGLFNGKIDGVRGPDTIEAIIEYQKIHNLKETGKVTPELLSHLENVGRVKVLIERLESVRKQRQDQARTALLSDPRTRNLIDSQKKEIADPTRDPSICFNAPTSSCLLNEAVESSRAVFEDDLRDWALGEILAAQVQVGLDQEAMKTASRIKDSRLIIAALANIAKTHVKEGKLEEAFSSLSLIPSVERRLSVLLDIAQVYYDRTDQKNLTLTIDKILKDSESIKEIETRLPIQIHAGEILAQSDKESALKILERVAEKVRNSTESGSKVTLLRHTASAMANIQFPEMALKTLEELPDDDTRIPVLMAATRSFLKMKRFDEALNTVSRISAERYRAVILADVALALWLDNQKQRAHETLDEAQVLAKKIPLPYAKNFALSQIATVLIKMVSDTKDTKLANQTFALLSDIGDERLKAKGLWDLAHASDLYGFAITEGDMSKAATQAVEDIKSNFSRAWMLGDLANDHQTIGEKVSAHKAFDMGLQTAKALTNPWARSRALAKFGAVMSTLD